MSDPRYAPIGEGMLSYLVGRLRPALAKRIVKSGRVETAVIGLGKQGTRHATLMKEFGTAVVGAVAPGKGGSRIAETIPVYESVAAMLAEHPDIAVASAWKHYSTAADATIETIEAGIPIVVLISEGMPVRDVQRVLGAARRHDTLLLGPNTPGVIFPPERVKSGMLPDVFQPAEPEHDRYSTEGVTICSRSGAILYHLSDALASAGIAQNAVIGVGGDSVIGTPFATIVPMVMAFPKTDLVVVAGEIGGCLEERLAEDMIAHPEKYPKPLVVLISGRCAPEGKRLGHAGAIVNPGAEYGTYRSKCEALRAAGVTVVNSQYDLVEAVRDALGGRAYFQPDRYHARMTKVWDAPPPKKTWTTSITRVAPNDVAIRGMPLAELTERHGIIEVAALLATGRLPTKPERTKLDKIARRAAAEPVPRIAFAKGDDVSRRLGGLMLGDAKFRSTPGDAEAERTVYLLGRAAAYLGHIFKTPLEPARSFSELAARAVAGCATLAPRQARMIEAAVVACADHGVTAPSTQTTILLSTVRAPLEVAVAGGAMAITDVHGGAGARATEFFLECAALARDEKLSPQAAAEKAIVDRTNRGVRRIEGLGHRIHTQDPRRDVLWRLAEKNRVAGRCVAVSRVAGDAFRAVRGMELPINVDGVIGAIVADMGLEPRVSKAIFLFGRLMGLAAHHFEEVSTQPPMRTVDFSQAVYRADGG